MDTPQDQQQQQQLPPLLQQPPPSAPYEPIYTIANLKRLTAELMMADLGSKYRACSMAALGYPNMGRMRVCQSRRELFCEPPIYDPDKAVMSI
ncbi:hypothetical protein HF086_004928 [Spodoptera exigua]|uniref:Uncharacterized protein n=1 Tax=Spodoptera exigua TaxID=7107 RepID=A0A922MTG1_SPOEX|nr:hypothetical protein HF086_004928 [Spodoptera exigua]